MSFFSELKRRNVVRATLAYGLVIWVLLQALDFGLDVISAPNWIIQALTLLAVAGLPIVVVFSWVYELTPDGIKREREVGGAESIAPHTGRKLDRVIIVFLAAALVVVLGREYLMSENRQDDSLGSLADNAEQPAAGDPAQMQDTAVAPVDDGTVSVAVLPFVNMSDDADNEYFSDGISEELLNVLVRLEGLRVPSRTSSFSFKGSEEKLDVIGAELGVDHILEGSVRKAGDRIRVTAQLIDVRTDTHLWSETYTRQLDDIFAVQDEISTAIVTALQVTLTGNDQQLLAQRETGNIEAYNLYLQGRQLWHQRTANSLESAINLLEQSVTLDPEYAKAWAALGDAFALLPEYLLNEGNPGDRSEMLRIVARAREAVNRALIIYPDSAQALTTRAYLRFMYDYDHQGANADFKRAIQISPQYATARQWYGEFLAVHRHIDQALEQILIATELDPLAPIAWHVAGWLVSQSGKVEEAVPYYFQALALQPDFAITHNNLAFAYAQLGQEEQSRRADERGAELDNRSADLASGRDLYAFDILNDPIKKQQFIDAVSHESSNFDSAVAAPLILMMIDETDLAMTLIERGFEKGDPYAVHVNRIVHYDSMRSNPRFQTHLARMNLWPENSAEFLPTQN